MILTFIDIAQFAYDAGFRGDPHAVAVALTVPESGRNPEAQNLDDPSGGSFGLMQINGVHNPDGNVATPEWIAKMKDPAENMKAAYQVWLNSGKSFNPWGAYTSNLHLPSMDAAKVALDGRARWKTCESGTVALKYDLATVTKERDLFQTEVAQLAAEVAALNSKIGGAVKVLTG